MSKLSRNKGKRGEREVVKLLAPFFEGCNIRRGWQSRAGSDEADIEGLPQWLWVEVKFRNVVDVKASLKQAYAALEKSGRDTEEKRRAVVVVFWRLTRQRSWNASMYLFDLKRLLDAELYRPWDVAWGDGLEIATVSGACAAQLLGRLNAKELSR